MIPLGKNATIFNPTIQTINIGKNPKDSDSPKFIRNSFKSRVHLKK
jgi:hypothetical protein